MERWRILHGACLASIRGPGDIDYDDGAMPRAPLEALVASLSREQVAAMGWVALADLAVWPQLPVDATDALLKALQAGDPAAPITATLGTPTKGKPPTSLLALAQLTAFLDSALAHVADPDQAPADHNTLRVAVDHLGTASRRSGDFWADWLIRVVPAAASTALADARAFALHALEGRLTTPDNFAYEATLMESGNEVAVHIVSPRPGGQVISTLGSFEAYAPKARQVRSRFIPNPSADDVDLYRMGYLFRTTLMAIFFQDHYEGRYDDVEVTHATTGETFRYEAL